MHRFAKLALFILSLAVSAHSLGAETFPATPVPASINPYTGGLAELAPNCIAGGTHWGVAWKAPGQPLDVGVFANGGGAVPPLPPAPPGFNGTGACGGGFGAAYFSKSYPCPSTHNNFNHQTGQCDRTTTPYTCPSGSNSTLSGANCSCDSPNFPTANAFRMVCEKLSSDKNNAGCPKVGNPCNPGTGIKTQQESVYRSLGDQPLLLDLTYNSRLPSDLSPPLTGQFGNGWIGTYQRKLSFAANGSVGALRSDGRTWSFKLPSSGTLYTPDADISDKLTKLVSGSVTTGWTLQSANGDLTETYDAAGKLLTIADRPGLTQTMTYSDGSTSPSVAPASGLLIKVTDSFGQEIQFNYDSSSRITKLIDQAGQQILFAYDGSNNLSTITFSDSTVRTFHYNESANTSGANLPNHLTGITDENSARFATYQYDTQGRAITTEHAGGAQRYSFLYNTDGTTQVTDALSTARTYNFATTLGVVKNTVSSQPCTNCGIPDQNKTYDANGNVATRLDWNNNRTNYTYDLARNLETSRVEGLTSSGSSTAATRTISTQWHSTFRLPVVIAEPLRKTTFAYNGDSGASCGFKADGVTLVPGVLCSKTVQATTDTNGSSGLSPTVTGTARVWAYNYNPNGSVLTMNGPRTDVADVTTYTYHANNATCSGASTVGCRGQVETITNAASHVTTISTYNAHGQPLSITDPNGLVTTLAYDTRLRLTSRTVGSEVTSYLYDGVGQLTTVTLPDTSFLSYTYDAAHRLTQIADNLGNKIVYTLDLMGNRTQEQVFDPSNTLAQTRSRVYNSLNRLTQEIGASSQTTAYTYDNQGNVTGIDGPLSGTTDVTVNAYDALNRLTQMTNPLSGVVGYGYNGVDQLTSVTDPRTLVTSYSYDGLNNLNQQASPDTGTTANTYDAAGNLLTSTDAKSQVTTYTYDVLNRVASIVYAGGVTHSYTYDQGTNGKGRLTQITEPNSVTAYAYDPQGRLLSETRTINGVPYATAYGYDSAGRMTSVTYPSGRVVNYTLDSLGHIQSVATTKDSTTQTVVSSVAYRPFGPSAGFTFGNGQTYSRGFDQDGRISSYTLATQSLAVGYDTASRITSLTDTVVPANTNTYGYDTLDRLTAFTGPSTNQGYTFDATGNRLTKTVGANTDTYTYSGTSNKLSTIAGSTNRTYGYDTNGSTTGDTANTYAYDTRGRMVQTTGAGGTSSYQLNSVGQRIRKTNTAGDTIYHYDAQGRLISETSASGTPQREYIYLGDTPVAVIQ
jgi:YD repeat-containing protein